MRMLERERRFLVPRLPAGLRQRPKKEIDQGYLAVQRGTEVRLRRSGRQRVLTVKHGARRKRVEVEVELHPAEFATLWRLTKGRRVRKSRYTLPYRRLTIEVDVYHGRLRGLTVAEVEFSSERQLRAFAAPDWIGREVTTDTRYDNRRLAEHAAPLLRADST